MSGALELPINAEHISIRIHMGNSVFGDLEVSEYRDLPEELTALAADVLRQYILEDGLKEDSDERILEMLMRVSERYMTLYMDVLSMHQKDPSWVSEWQTRQNSAFIDHAFKYSPLYGGIKHMALAPYFSSAWSIAFLVEVSVNALELQDKEDFESFYWKQPKKTQDHYQYVLRFGENLLIKFYDAFKQR